MAVRLFLSSGAQRVIDDADGAGLDEPFCLVTKWYPAIRRRDTVLTLRAEDVLAAEVLQNDVVIDYVVGQKQEST